MAATERSTDACRLRASNSRRSLLLSWCKIFCWDNVIFGFFAFAFFFASEWMIGSYFPLHKSHLSSPSSYAIRIKYHFYDQNLYKCVRIFSHKMWLWLCGRARVCKRALFSALWFLGAMCYDSCVCWLLKMNERLAPHAKSNGS